MGITLAFDRADIAYNGLFLRVWFRFTGTGMNPLPAAFRCALIRGYPTLTLGSTPIHLIWEGPAWEIDRTGDGEVELLAKYRLHPDQRILRSDTASIVVSLAAEMIEDDLGNHNGEVDEEDVTNNSRVGADGFIDLSSDAVDPTSVFVDPVNGSNANNGFSMNAAKELLGPDSQSRPGGIAAFAALGSGPHRLLLKAGEVHDDMTGGIVTIANSGSGVGAEAVIASYGEGARPVIEALGFHISGNHVVVSGIDFQWDGTNSGGFGEIGTQNTHAIFDDCRLRVRDSVGLREEASAIMNRCIVISELQSPLAMRNGCVFEQYDVHLPNSRKDLDTEGGHAMYDYSLGEVGRINIARKRSLWNFRRASRFRSRFWRRLDRSASDHASADRTGRA